MKTYLFKDSTHYKIGKSIDVSNRYYEMLPHNPTLRPITFIDKNIESQLHKKYKRNRTNYEWFVFSDNEIKSILIDDFNNPSIEEIKCLNYTILSGKYVNRKLVSMFDISEINWLKSFQNIEFDYWTKFYMRFYCLKDELINLPSSIKDNYTQIKGIDNFKKIELLKNILLDTELLSIQEYANKYNLSYNGVKKKILNNSLCIINIGSAKYIIDG